MTRTVSVRLMADVADFTRKVGGTAAGSVKSLSGELDKANRAGKLDKVTQAATGLGLGLVGVAAAAVKMAADFDKQMSAVSAATHAGTKDMAALRAAAIQAGKDTQYSATEAAKGVTELAKAGVGTADILGGGLKGALALAAAGQLSVGDAAETAASAMTQFGLKGSQVPHVADLLAAAAGKAQGSVHDMGFALNQSGIVAHQFGLSIEDTTGVLAEFAHAGLLGSDAGTSLKTMLLAIANPSKQTRDKMDELGVSFYDAQGKFVGLSGVAEILRQRLSKLTDQQREQTFGQLFGNDAVRAAGQLYEDGAKGVETWKNKVTDAGYASESAAKLTDNLAGDIERLKGSVETLAIESGSGASGGLRFLAKAVNGLVNEFLGLPSAVGGTLTVLAGVGGALALGSVAWLKYRETVAKAQAQLIATGPAGEKAATALGSVSKWAGRAAAALAALEVAKTVAHGLQSDLNPQIDALGVSLQKYAEQGVLAGEASRVLGGDLHDLSTGFKFLADTDNARRGWTRNLQGGLESVIPGLDGMNTSLTKTKERITSVDQALAQMVGSGQATQAKAAFDRLAAALAVGGVSMEEFRKQFPAYAGALEVAGSTTKATASKLGDLNSALQVGADGQDKYATAAQAAAGAARGERDAFVALASAVKAETDPVFGLLDAEQSLAGAQKDATKAIKEHGRNSDEAREATRKLALAAIDLEGKAGALSGTFNGKMTPALHDTLHAAGLTEAQIKDVATQFKQAKTDGENFAKNYPASASLTGYPAVKDRLTGLLLMQEALRKGVPASAIAATNKNVRQGFSDGGYTGPGSKYQPAGVVHADEFVIKSSSRQSIERQAPGVLDSMNVTGRMPGYSGGGMVWPFPVNVRGTRIPSRAEAQAVVGSAGPTGGGSSYRWIEAIVRAAFPGLGVISDFRAGATTLSGNRSYHAVGRAVDYPPSLALAEWFNLHYFGKIKELITPWNNLNIKNGQRHTYTGAVWNQHNFAGGNAHDHIAMFGGGVINEPVFGYGASGRSYSFGERGTETVVPGMPSAGGGRGAVTYQINVTPTATAHPADIGREVVAAITEFERGSGARWRNG